MILVQESDPVYCHGDGAEVFFYFSLKNIGSRSIQHVAISMIYFGKQHGFIYACLVLKRDKFHGLAVFGPNCLAGDLPTDGGDLFSNHRLKVLGSDIIHMLQDVLVSIEGMHGEEKAQGLVFVLEHKGFGVRGWLMVRPIPDGQ